MPEQSSDFYDKDYFLGTSENRGNFSLLELGQKFRDRTDTVIDYFELASAPSLIVTEIGCGTAPFYRIIRSRPNLNHIHVQCTDISDQGIALLGEKERPPFTQSNAESLPYEDSSMDGAIMWDLLEHVEQPKSLLEEAYRVLKPGGFLHIVCPNPDSWLREAADPENDPYRRDSSHIIPAIVTVEYLDLTLRGLGFLFEQFTRGFEGSTLEDQSGLESMRPASVDSTGTHLVVFARKA